MWLCLQARLGCREVVAVPLSTSRLEVHNSGSDVLSNRRFLTSCELCALCRGYGALRGLRAEGGKALGLACVCSARLPDSLAVL